MSLSGDFAGLQKLIGRLGAVSVRPITRNAARASVQQYRADFTDQSDPWGRAWKPTKLGKSPVLNTTGALANPLVVIGPGFVKIKPERYWVYHAVGAHGMAKRETLPFRPSRWDGPIHIVIGRTLIAQIDG